MLTIAPNTSNAFELLCLLSRTPAAIADLMTDTGWDEVKLRNNIASIRGMNINVHVSRSTVWLADRSWKRAQAAAMSYHERTYGY